MTKLLQTLLLASFPLMCLLPQVAMASPVTLHLGNMQFAGPTTVNIKNLSPTAGPEYVYSGALAATASDTAGSFEAWCIDVFQNAYFNWSGTDYVRESASIFPGSVKAGLLLRLATESLGMVTDARTSSAFQLATWEIVNETDSTYSLDSGNFTAWGASDTSIALANDWLAHLPGVNTPNKYAISVLHSETTQDFAVFTAVPEPASIALLGLGLVGLCISRRKSAKRNHA